MTAIEDHNVPAFRAAATQLRKQGYSVVNPAEISAGMDGASWAEYMRADIKMLCECDSLALLPGWEHSAGAHLELQIAHRLGMHIATVDKYLEMEVNDDPNATDAANA